MWRQSGLWWINGCVKFAPWVASQASECTSVREMLEKSFGVINHFATNSPSSVKQQPWTSYLNQNLTTTLWLGDIKMPQAGTLILITLATCPHTTCARVPAHRVRWRFWGRRWVLRTLFWKLSSRTRNRSCRESSPVRALPFGWNKTFQATSLTKSVSSGTGRAVRPCTALWIVVAVCYVNIPSTSPRTRAYTKTRNNNCNYKHTRIITIMTVMVMIVIVLIFLLLLLRNTNNKYSSK